MLVFEIGECLLGRYEILERPQRRGPELVFKARDRELGRLCLLRVLDARGDVVERRFRRARRIGTRLRGLWQVVRAFDLGEIEPGMLCMALNFIEDALPLEMDPNELAMSLENLNAAAEVVARVHEAGVIHRDLRPERFLVVEPGEVYLTGFELAREAEAGDGRDLFDDSIKRDTSGYLAPEQIEDFSRADESSDIFSLGVMLFSLLTGRRDLGSRPWESWDLREPTGDIPDALLELCSSALAPDSADRPESAEAFAEALREIREALYGDPEEAA